ncbi:P-loop domain protein, KAP family [Anopheles sinensis]|uniref:P-loop domain protein, KAP family n=1 Tax=Anopheles sinensis TaxID=74873 RepID=A0A084WHB6_ANOSI|nr:P-loop domain protein, KAP family [Anopheles sinensis]
MSRDPATPWPDSVRIVGLGVHRGRALHRVRPDFAESAQDAGEPRVPRFWGSCRQTHRLFWRQKGRKGNNSFAFVLRKINLGKLVLFIDELGRCPAWRLRAALSAHQSRM